MRYHDPDSKGPVPSENNGYWIHGDDVYDVTFSSHVRLIVENPVLFGTSAAAVQATYHRYHESPGSEGQAREELVRRAASQGWVRVRHYSHPDYWIIQCDDTTKRLSVIREFLRWGVKQGIVKQTDEARIGGFCRTRDRLNLKWKDGGVGKFIHASRQRKTGAR